LGIIGFAVAVVLVAVQLRISQRHLQTAWQQIEHSLESKGRLLVADQAVAMRAFAADNGFVNVRQLIEQTLAGDQDLLYGTFVDWDGHTWAYGDRHLPTADPTRNDGWRTLAPPPPSLGEGVTIRNVRFGGEEIAEFATSVPVEGQGAGLLRYGVSLAAMRQASQVARSESRRTMAEILAFLSGVGLLALVLGGVVMRRQAAKITQPLAELGRAAQAVADGHPGIHVTIHSGDEIELLGANFNKMVQSLETSYTALKCANAQLKQEMDERLKIEIELRQVQKLEAVGRLASGIAHEINTPIQFVNDSIHFVRDATVGLQQIIDHYKTTLQAAPDGDWSVQAKHAMLEAEEAADLPYLVQELPAAIERSIDGLGRVSTIVRSMKEFAHPGQNEIASVDLNHAISTTLTIARNEYKYVADVETHLGELPLVPCCQGEFNQAFLNILINATHAIGDVVGTTGAKGRITIATSLEGDFVLVTVADTGAGIPVAVRDRIFDPFFTTKDVGRGTGQGLPIARSVIVDKHQGQLTFESEIGKGTSFFIRLPLQRAVNAGEKSPADGVRQESVAHG
jgi:signal transduction histidine kinase